MTEKPKHKTRIPFKKIKVGYQDVNVEVVPTMFHKDALYGEYDNRRNKIDINAELSSPDAANTLLHEIAHACAWIGGLSAGDKPILDEIKEEQVVNILSNMLLGVVKDNPGFLPWLNSQIHGSEKTIQQVSKQNRIRTRKKKKKRGR